MLTDDELFDLADYLYEKIDRRGCDHSVRFTKRWLRKNGIRHVRDVLEEFELHGGFCDCEVFLNVCIPPCRPENQ
jgi:hypothetical protein